jgi:hypothetical protein
MRTSEHDENINLNLNIFLRAVSNKVCETVEPYNLYVSQNVISVIKSRRMRWVGHVASMKNMRNAYRILVGNLKARGHSEDVGVDGKIIF